MKAKITRRAGKGAQQILPSKGAVRKLTRDPRTSIVSYAKAGPDVVQNGPSIVGRKT